MTRNGWFVCVGTTSLLTLVLAAASPADDRHHDWHSGEHHDTHEGTHWAPDYGWHSGRHHGWHSGEHHDSHDRSHDWENDWRSFDHHEDRRSFWPAPPPGRYW